MKKLALLVIFMFTVSCFAQEQAEDLELKKYLKRAEGYKYPNVLKVNSMALVFRNISLSYERALVPRLSFNISAGYKYAGRTPKLLEVEGSSIDADLKEIVGFSVTPELRYYLKSCDDRLLEGFYVGLYMRYTKYTSGANFGYFPDEQPEAFYDSDVSLSEVGGGLQFGYQLVLWQRFNIDFMFLGPRFSKYNIIYEFDQNVSEAFLNDLSTYLNDVIDRFGLDYEVDLKQSGEARASNSFSFAAIRFGISLGFAF